MPSFIWLILVIVFIVFEAVTAALTTVWFAAGALAAYVVSLVSESTALQVATFLLVSILFLLLLRPWVAKHVNQKTTKTNAAGLIGRTALVTEVVDNLQASGSITVDGMPWMARTRSNTERIEAGTYVTIEEISGAKCIVKQAGPDAAE